MYSVTEATKVTDAKRRERIKDKGLVHTFKCSKKLSKNAAHWVSP